MNEATIELSAAQTASWADAQWKAGYLSGLQRFVGADIERATIVDPDGKVLGTYERAWSSV